MDASTPGGFTAPAPQFALLDMFFPGFSVFSSAVEKYFHVDLNLYIPLVIFLGCVTFMWRYFSEYFWEKLEAYFMSTVDIRTDDEIYNMLMAWVAQQKFAKGARRFVVNTNLNSRAWYLWRWDDDDDEGPEDGDDSSAPHGKKKKALAYTPTFGSHFFWYKGRICIFRRDKGRDQQAGYMLVSEREEISISCFGRDPWLLKELLMEARTQFTQRDEHKTLIYRGTIPAGTTTPAWQRCLARASRPFSTVILNDKVKQDLIDDVQDYLNPATRRWYSNRGIPYRRGYLLYGPPGTGKSSLSLALAGFFKMRIYIVSLSSVTSNEENLSTLFAELPRRCVVLLEDIDTAGLTHTREDNKSSDASNDDKDDDMVPGQLTKGTDPTNTNNNNGRLSLSGLLNILDGVASQEGRVLIMTTNHIDKLDKALIRPGRVDMIVKFDLADTGMVSSIFRAIFAPLEGDNKPSGPEAEAVRDPEEVKRLVAADKTRRDEITAEIEKLAEVFAAKIPAHEFSPAELQGYLLKNKRDAEGAVRGAEAWVSEARKEKAAKQLKDAEDKRKKEEEESKAKEEAEKKKSEKEDKKKRKKNKKGGKSKKEDRKGKDDSSSESGSDSSSSSSSESESEAEAKKDKRHKSKGKTDVKIKIDGVKEDEQADKAPASAATEKSDGFIDIEKDDADTNGRPRTQGTDSGYGTP